MADDANITPRPGDPRLARDRLRVIRGGESPAEAITVDAPSADSMRGLDFEEMLLSGSEPASEPVPEPIVALTEEPEASELQPASAVASEIEQIPTVEELDVPSGTDDFELSYSDGSTTPVDPPRRSLVRRRSRGQEEPVDEARLAQALEDSTADVWAAHRDESWAADGTDAWGPTAEPFAAEPQPQRDGGGPRGLAVLALIALLVVVVGAGAFVAVNGGVTPIPAVTHKPKTARGTQTVAQTVSPPAVTTAAKTVVKKHHKQRAVHHRKATTHVTGTAKTTTTTAPATTAVGQTTAPVADNTSTGAAGSTTPVKTTTSSSSSTPTNNESPGGALPGLQQTQQAP